MLKEEISVYILGCMRIFKIMDNKIEKILEDINKLQGYKVTYQYATAINIKDNNMNPWFEKLRKFY